MISCMNKFAIILLFVILLTPAKSLSQKTYYYQLRKKIHNRHATTNVNGGQFITFSGDLCFESNKNGVGVGHGTLMRKDNYSTGSFLVYLGKSYWGNDATFKFTKDLSILNVILGNGDKYLYKRAVAPTGVITCSLIRGSLSNTSEGSSRGIDLESFQPDNSGSGYNVGSSNRSVNGIGVGGLNQQPQHQRTWRDCSLCHGKGTIIRDSNISTYGMNDTQVYCSECGRSYHRSTGHNHITCPICHGKRGFWSE